MSQLKVEKVPSVEDRTLPIFSEFDKVTDRIRQRAYDFFSQHGFGDGHDVEDWLKAEREVCWPAAELAEDDEELTLKVALAGFDADDITVTANPRALMIKARQESEKSSEKDEDESKLCWSEFRSEDVYRQVALPHDVDVDKIKASFKRGMLKIEMPKAAAKKSAAKTVEISSAA